MGYLRLAHCLSYLVRSMPAQVEEIRPIRRHSALPLLHTEQPVELPFPVPLAEPWPGEIGVIVHCGVHDTADYQPHYEMVGYRREGYRQGQENVLTSAEIQCGTEHCNCGHYG